MSDEHCKDCCCARSWDALNIHAYTGKSIPEHIEALRAENERLRAALSQIFWAIPDNHIPGSPGSPLEVARECAQARPALAGAAP